MRITPITQVTDAVLLASSVPETPPAAYAAGTTYAANATVSTGTAGGVLTVWKSLQADNLGHDPATSPSWWVSLGTTYALYAVGTSWALGAIVLDVTTHHLYESQTAANLGNALTDTVKWLDLGIDNRHAMFDTLRNTRSIVPGSLSVTLAPGKRCNTLVLAGMVSDSAQVVVTSGATEVFNRTVTLRQRQTLGWYDYWFGEFTTRATLMINDLPPYTDAQITVTLSVASGNVECGACIVGSNVYVGDTEWKPRISGLNYGQVTRDKYNNAVLDPQRSLPTNELGIAIKAARVNRIRDLLDTIDGVPAVFSGIDDDTNNYFDALFILGFVRRFDIVPDAPNDAMLTLSLEEI